MDKREGNVIEKNETKSNKKKLILWASLALIVMVVLVAFLLIFLIPKEQKYYIGLESNIDIVLEGDGEYKEGEEVTISAADIDGYRFRNWTLNGIEISREQDYTFKAGSDTDGKYTANYDKLFTVTVQEADILSVDKTEAIENEEINITIDNIVGMKSLYYILEGTDERVEIVNNKFNMPLGNVAIFVYYGEELQQKGLIFEIDDETKTANLIEAPTDVVVPQSFSYHYESPVKQYTLNEDVLTLKIDILDSLDIDAFANNLSKVIEYFSPMVDSQFAFYSDVLYTPNNEKQSIGPILMSEFCGKIVFGEFTEEDFPMTVEVQYSLSFDEPSNFMEIMTSGDLTTIYEAFSSPKFLSDYAMFFITFPSSGGIFDQTPIWNSVNSKDMFTFEMNGTKSEIDLEKGLLSAFVAYFQTDSYGYNPADYTFPIHFDFTNIKNVVYTEGDDYIVDGIRKPAYTNIQFEDITIPSTIKSIVSEYDYLNFNNTIRFLGDLDQWLSMAFDYINFNNKELYINGEIITELVLDKNIELFILNSFGQNLKKLTITENVSDLTNLQYVSTSNTNIEEVVVESANIYKNLTSNYVYNDLIANTATIRVLKTIVDNPENTNTYLNDTSNYTKTEEGDYYVYTK